MQNDNSLTGLFGEVICSYTADDAVRDGVQFDVSTPFPNDTRVYKHPVHVTAKVWELIKDAANEKGNVWVWDLCAMSTNPLTSRRVDDYTRYFQCILPRSAKSRAIKKYDMTSQVNVGDGGRPIICISMRGED